MSPEGPLRVNPVNDVGLKYYQTAILKVEINKKLEIIG
jgi:hypothetical protein